MTFVIIIFFISIILAFGMLIFRAWEIKTERIKIEEDSIKTFPELPFRHLEKNMLYLTKYVVQGMLFVFAKYWFILVTKIRKWFNAKWPKINKYFRNKQDPNTSYRHSFIRRAVLESKAKIKHIKMKVKEEIEEHID